MAGIVDSHAHVCAGEPSPKWREAAANAKEAGMEKIMLICRNVQEVARGLELAEMDSMFDVAAGFYPNDILKLSFAEWYGLLDRIRDPRVKAVGEIGMDYSFYETVAPQVLQKEAFVRQMEIANEVKKPVIIHMRHATDDTRRYIKVHLRVGGVMHGYSGGYRAMREFLDMGLYLSFSPAAILESYREDARKVAAEVPLERILVESNAPFRAPDSGAGRLHGPEAVAAVMDYLCMARGIEREVLAQAVRDNYRRLFEGSMPEDGR